MLKCDNMFTGIIEQIGTILENQQNRLKIKVDNNFIDDIKIGSSIAVNGVCLTVVERLIQPSPTLTKVGHGELVFDVMPETLRRTNLGKLRAGSQANLERALKVGGRWEGHIVQGHVDASALVQSLKFKVQSDGQKEAVLTIELPKGLAKYIVPKGSIAIDGVSLTVVDVEQNYFTVAIIPHTMERAIIKNYQKGTKVNIEVDILAKYLLCSKNKPTTKNSNNIKILKPYK
jgi:riboflavin synthase